MALLLGCIASPPAYLGHSLFLIIQEGLMGQFAQNTYSQGGSGSGLYAMPFWLIAIGLLCAFVAGMMLNHWINRLKKREKPNEPLDTARDVEILENNLYKSVWASTQV